MKQDPQVIRFKDVAHLYTGCKLWTPENKGIYSEIWMTGITTEGMITAIGIMGDDPVHYPLSGTWYGNAPFSYLQWFKPVLKSLPRLTIEDAVKMDNENHFPPNSTQRDAYHTILLARLGYDLFDLIGSGEAIEKESGNE